MEYRHMDPYAVRLAKVKCSMHSYQSGLFVYLKVPVPYPVSTNTSVNFLATAMAVSSGCLRGWHSALCQAQSAFWHRFQQ